MKRVLSLFCGLGLAGSVAPAASTDILTRCEETATWLRAEARATGDIARRTAVLRWGFLPTPLASNERAYLRGMEPLAAGRAGWRPLTRAYQRLRDRMEDEPAGVGTYYALSGELDRVVRRDLAWTRLDPDGRAGVLVVERDRPVGDGSGEPLTGKWIGACSASHWREGGAGGSSPVAERQAGTVSALILQDEDRWYARLSLPGLTTYGTGRHLQGELRWLGQVESAAPSAPVRWEGQFDAVADRIDGTLTGGTPDRLFRYTIYLERVRDEGD